MKKIILSLTLVFGSVNYLLAQNVFTYGNKAVSKSEFERVYDSKNQNSADFRTLKGLQDYVDLYSVFKMKVADAREQGLDTVTSLKNDLYAYKTQLAKSYLTDISIQDNLLKEAYERSKEEVEIAHIHISVRGNDTLAGYEKAQQVYSELKEGKLTYEEAVKKYSEDGASKTNGGNIGYVSALDVLYPIETVAYTIPVGTYGAPVRTNVGYHIVKVLNKRPSLGQVQVAQILVLANPKDQASVEIGKSKAQKYYQDLKSGADFETMVKNYSEDKFSVNNGGVLPAFSAGKTDINLEKAAFALKNVGDISEPIQTEFGFHILKLIKKIPVPTFESSKADLLARMKTDKRVEIAEEAMKQKQLQDLGFAENSASLNELVEVINKDTAKVPKITTEQFSSYNSTLFTLDKKNYTQKDFIDFVIDATNGNLYGRKEKTIRDLYRMYTQKTIQDVQLAHLESTIESFKNIVQEYEDGNLLFALMEKKVWNRAMSDAEGLYSFYENNKEKYKFNAGFGGTIFESTSQTSLENLAKKLNEGGEIYESITEINANTAGKISTQSGKYEYQQMPAKMEVLEKDKISKVFQADNGNFFMILPDVVFGDGTFKTFEEARGQVISDYQSLLDKEWVEDLKTKYPLKVNDKVLKSLVKKK